MKLKNGLSAIFLALCSATTVVAADYPDRPVRVITTDGAGGVIDQTVRALADELAKRLGQPIVVDNKPGASGMIASAAAAKAMPDGYTLLATSAYSQVVVPVMFEKTITYDPVRDLAPVSLLAGSPFVFLVQANSPIRSLGDLIALARKKGEAFTMASTGPGTLLHLTLERFRREVGLDKANYVPFKTGAQASTALASGEVDVVVDPLATALPLVSAGKIRPIAVTSPTRFFLTPDIPTVKESGGPDLSVFGWLALLSPAGTPPAAMRRVADAVAGAMASPNVKERFKTIALTPLPQGEEALRQMILEEGRVYRGLIEQLGLKQ